MSDHQMPVDGSFAATQGALDLCRGADLLIHDAQYTPAEFVDKNTWGHCTVEYAVWLAASACAQARTVPSRSSASRRRHGRPRCGGDRLWAEDGCRGLRCARGPHRRTRSIGGSGGRGRRRCVGGARDRLRGRRRIEDRRREGVAVASCDLGAPGWIIPVVPLGRDRGRRCADRSVRPAVAGTRRSGDARRAHVAHRCRPGARSAPAVRVSGPGRPRRSVLDTWRATPC